MTRARNRTGGGVGTNQYQIKRRSSSDLAQGQVSNLISQIRDNLVPPNQHIGSDSPLVRQAVAAHCNVGAVDCEKLTKDTDIDVRQAALANPCCPASVLTRSARKANRMIRAAITSNPMCPVEILERFARDKDYFTRHAVASHLQTPPQYLAQLIQDTLPGIQEAAARNPNTPIDALIVLVGGPDHRLRRIVLARPDIPDHIRAIVNLSL